MEPDNNIRLIRAGTFEAVLERVKNCQGKHTQQVAFSSFHNALTQVCFGCGIVCTNLVPETPMTSDDQRHIGIDGFEYTDEDTEPMEMFTQGQMDAFAVENVETERKRLHGILSRVLGKEYFPEHELEIIQDPRPMIQEILDKVVLNNKK